MLRTARPLRDGAWGLGWGEGGLPSGAHLSGYLGCKGEKASCDDSFHSSSWADLRPSPHCTEALGVLRGHIPGFRFSGFYCLWGCKPKCCPGEAGDLNETGSKEPWQKQQGVVSAGTNQRTRGQANHECLGVTTAGHLRPTPAAFYIAPVSIF